MRRPIASLAVIAMTVAGLIGFAPSASAGDYGCAGSLVYSKNLTGPGNEVWSTAKLYYSSANGGTNCMVLVAKKYAGIKHYMYAMLRVDGRTGSHVNEGQFAWYAGPVVRTNTDGHCVSGGFWEYSPDNSIQTGAGFDSVACG
ncbi:hypothetical protein [Streptomyces sp. NPDC058955]|uniref:hypothetical protein n=1 Tax=unclassified Streptomyces TaxID=2593676 RepID=UPI0036696BD5